MTDNNEDKQADVFKPEALPLDVKKLEIAARSQLDHRVFKELGNEHVVKFFDDKVMGQFIAQLECWASGLGEQTLSIHEQWPRDWWQAFRERWFPRWWLKKHPIKYKHIHVEQKIYKAVCPHNLGIATKKEDHLRWLFWQEHPSAMPKGRRVRDA
jgi:hypothetical protein